MIQQNSDFVRNEKLFLRKGKSINLRNDYSFSYNDKIKNKKYSDKKELNQFTSYGGGSANNLIDIIKKGFAFSPSVYRNSHRCQENFIKCDIVAFDVDNTEIDSNGEKCYTGKLTLERAIANEFIKKHFVIYTSPSHTEEWHRFRLIGFLPVTIDNGELVKELLKLINNELGNVADTACLESARLFYGNSNAQWFNTDLNNVYELPYEFVLEAKENLARTTQERELRRQERVEIKVSDNEIEQHLNTLYDIPPRQKGNNTYELYLSLIWGLCSLSESEDFRQKITDILESQGIFSGSEKGFAQKIVKDYRETKASHSLGSYIYAYEQLTGGKYPVKLSRGALSKFSEFQQWLIKGFNGLSKGFLRGFKAVKVELPNLSPDTIIYSPDVPLPSPSDYELSVIPEFIIPRKYLHLKAKLKAQLLGLGWVLHDNSFMGEGKSHDVAFLGNVLYLDTNYKNPSIKDIDKMPVMPSRLQYGLFEVEGKQKADPVDHGKYQRIKPSNCHLKPLFRGLEDKGYSIEGDNNPICGKCPHNKKCGLVTDFEDTFGFKGERRLAISKMKTQGQGRAHYKQIQPDMLREGFKEFTVAFEEAGTVNLTNSVTANIEMIDSTIAKITRIKTDLNGVDIGFRKELVINFLNKLRDILVNAYQIAKTANTSHKYYGLDKTTILDNLTIPELTENELFILQNEFELDIDQVMPDFVGIDRDGINDKDFRRKVRNAENYLKSQQLEDIKENLSKLQNNWFILFINILFGYENGTFRINKSNELEVITIDDHHQQLARTAHGVLLLDATKSTKQLRAIYGLNERHIMTFKTELPPLNNLKVINVNMSGLSSNNWSDNCLERLTALKLELTARHNDNIAFLMPKKYCEPLENKYYFGKDDRGSNELMGYESIAHFGKPMPNLGEAKIIYELYIDIDNYSFEEFYQDLVREAQLQGVGRSRAQHCPDKTFYHYFVGTNQDMSFLESYGVNVENVNVIEICETAGSKGDRTRQIILESARAIVANGQKLTQEAIAEINNFSQQLVSKAFKNSELSWKAFKNLLLNLYSSHKEKVVKNNNGLDLLEVWLNEGNTDVLELAVNKVISEGMDGLIQIATDLNATFYSLYRLLWLIAPLYDKRLLEFREKMLLELS